MRPNDFDGAVVTVLCNLHLLAVTALVEAQSLGADLRTAELRVGSANLEFGLVPVSIFQGLVADPGVWVNFSSNFLALGLRGAEGGDLDPRQQLVVDEEEVLFRLDSRLETQQLGLHVGDALVDHVVL